MTKIIIDREGIVNDIIPKIDSAIDCLNNSLGYDTILNIPYDFDYAGYLKGLPDKNYYIKDLLVKKKRMLDAAVEEYSKIEENNISDFAEIKTVIIDKKI